MDTLIQLHSQEQLCRKKLLEGPGWTLELTLTNSQSLHLGLQAQSHSEQIGQRCQQEQRQKEEGQKQGEKQEGQKQREKKEGEEEGQPIQRIQKYFLQITSLQQYPELAQIYEGIDELFQNMDSNTVQVNVPSKTVSFSQVLGSKKKKIHICDVQLFECPKQKQLASNPICEELEGIVQRCQSKINLEDFEIKTMIELIAEQLSELIKSKSDPNKQKIDQCLNGSVNEQIKQKEYYSKLFTDQFSQTKEQIALVQNQMAKVHRRVEEEIEYLKNQVIKIRNEIKQIELVKIASIISQIDFVKEQVKEQIKNNQTLIKSFQSKLKSQTKEIEKKLHQNVSKNDKKVSKVLEDSSQQIESQIEQYFLNKEKKENKIQETRNSSLQSKDCKKWFDQNYTDFHLLSFEKNQITCISGEYAEVFGAERLAQQFKFQVLFKKISHIVGIGISLVKKNKSNNTVIKKIMYFSNGEIDDNGLKINFQPFKIGQRITVSGIFKQNSLCFQNSKTKKVYCHVFGSFNKTSKWIPCLYLGIHSSAIILE